MGEITAGRDVAFVRREAFASPVGVVFEVHAVDAACLHMEVEQKQRSFSQKLGFAQEKRYNPTSCPIGVKESSPAGRIFWPNIFRGSTMESKVPSFKGRGVPTSDSRSKAYANMARAQYRLCFMEQFKIQLSNLMWSLSRSNGIAHCTTLCLWDATWCQQRHILLKGESDWTWISKTLTKSGTVLNHISLSSRRIEYWCHRSLIIRNRTSQKL